MAMRAGDRRLPKTAGARCINRLRGGSTPVNAPRVPPAGRVRKPYPVRCRRAGPTSERCTAMTGDPAVVELVARAREGDKSAWDDLVERFAPLVWSICRRFRLARTDAEDVSQGVWLRLVEHLSDLREPTA